MRAFLVDSLEAAMKVKRPSRVKRTEEKGQDYLTELLGRPSRGEIVDAAIERLRTDLEEVRKLTLRA